MSDFARQSEFLFLWDGETWNPNGDMLNDNAPRFDDVSQKALISDVRIKRTIRDDLYHRKNEEIFVIEEKFKEGIADGKQRVKTLAGDHKEKIQVIIDQCVDVRAFGGVFPVEKESLNLTGTIQMKLSKSLHQAEKQFVKGTGGFASKAGDKQKTFREEYLLPYALFGTYGVINAINAGKTQLTGQDVDKILGSLWYGTKNLLSRSKISQIPRMLLKVTYKTPGCFIGELDNLVTLQTDKPKESEIRSLDDYTIDLSIIAKRIEGMGEQVESVEWICDERFKSRVQGYDSKWQNLKLDL